VRPPAIVVDVGFVNGLGAIRSLGRAGLRVVAVDHRPSALGFRSRFAERVLAPSPLADEQGFVEKLRELGPGVVFCTHDEGLAAIARHRDELELLCPFPRDLERIQRKRVQLAAARDVPETRFPTSAGEAVAAARELGYPVLVKPSEPVGFRQKYGVQAVICETDAAVEDAYGRSEPFEPMVQELIPGGDDELYSLGAYLSDDLEPLGLFCGRKLRQTPPGIGTARLGEAVWVDEVVDAGLELLRALGCNGLSQVEFKRDPRDGRFKLMEINPRLWQWHTLARACGVDLPLIAYRDQVGETVEPVRMNGRRRKWALALMPNERPLLPRPPFVEPTLAWDDPKPALVHAARVALNTIRS
jgi:predicted ATP-grasp superfamily ATP-dependent carboligase